MAKPKFVSKADAARGFELQLVDDSGVKIDWFIKVVGADADVYREKLTEIQRRNINDINRARRLVLTPEEREADEVDLLVAATVGWRGDDAMAPFSAAEALRIYTAYRQIAAQVDRAISDRSNFLPDAATA